MWEAVLSFVRLHPDLTIVGAVTLIQITPIRINPWSSLIKWARHLFIGGIEDKIDGLTKKVEKVEDLIEERDAILARTHILRFNDELYNGIKHSKEYFDQQLEDIDRYDHYCDAHPEFKNSRTVMASKNIKEIYNRLLEEHKFL